MSQINLLFEQFALISSKSGRNDKMQLLKEAASSDLHETLKKVLYLTHDPFRNYYLRIDKKAYPQEQFQELSEADAQPHWNRFETLLEALRRRLITGDKARALTKTTLATLPYGWAFWCARIINRDLEIGLQWSSYEKVFPDLISVPSPQLAEEYKGVLESGETYFVEDKFDGFRCHVVVKSAQEIAFLSRNGKPLFNFEHIEAAIRKYVEKTRHVGFVLDAEDYQGSWAASASAAKKQAAPSVLKSLVLFDYIPLWAWEKGKKSGYTMPLWLRRQELQKIVSGIIDCDIPDIHKHLTISSVTSIYHADEVPHLSASALARGREGIMIKNANGLYEGTRSSAWMKYKPWDTSTFIIVGYEKGSVGSKNEDRLGAVIVEGTVSIRGKNVSVRCKAGQGFKDKERDEFHELYLTNQLFGKIIDLKYQKFDEAAVLSSTDDVIALRNAVFKGFRSDLE